MNLCDEKSLHCARQWCNKMTVLNVHTKHGSLTWYTVFHVCFVSICYWSATPLYRVIYKMTIVGTSNLTEHIGIGIGRQYAKGIIDRHVHPSLVAASWCVVAPFLFFLDSICWLWFLYWFCRLCVCTICSQYLTCSENGVTYIDLDFSIHLY